MLPKFFPELQKPHFFLLPLKKKKLKRLHNYPIVVATRLADPTLHNMWNKIGWILKCFEDYPDADW